MRKKLSLASLNDLKKDFKSLNTKEQMGVLGGGSGTLDDPYTWDEYCALDSIGDCYYVWGGVTMHSFGEYVCSGIFENTYLGITEDSYSGSSSGYGNDSPWGKWADLTPQERAFISDHPIDAYNFYNNAQKAGDAFNGWCDEGDALRHAYWSALNQMSVGYDSGDARRFGQCHECVRPTYVGEKEMDLHNNDVGFEYGRKAIQEGWDEERLLEELRKASERGELRVLTELIEIQY